MAYLTLCDGTIFEGESFGYKGDVIGEIAVNTSMTGYQELITHPASYGQLVCMTYPLIGNYGVNAIDNESDYIYAKALIINNYCKNMSSWRAEESLSGYLAKHCVAGIHSIDTRALCKKLKGESMVAIISQNKLSEKELSLSKDYRPSNGLSKVSTKELYEIKGKSNKKVAVIDYGLSKSMLNTIVELGYTVKVFPHNTTANIISEYNPQGIILSDGPGDPRENKEEINNIKKLFLLDTAIFAVGLGHQMLALAKGGEIFRLNNSHRSSNSPIKELNSNRLYVTVQNHEYAVDEQSLISIGQITHRNCNDNSIEGVQYNKKTYSIQFEPKKVIGPQSTIHLVDKFLEFVEG